MEGEKENWAKHGLPDGWTRATFIVRQDLLEKLKDHAWTERMTLKEAVEQMMAEYLADKNPLQRRK